MAIVHDAWLFDPRGFAEAMAGYAKAIAQSSRDGYWNVRAAALAALDQAGAGWNLAERYGGWDKASLLFELPDQYAGDPESIAFCFTLLLYAHLAKRNTSEVSLGLQSLWRNSQELLHRLNWEPADRELLIKGHDFGVLVDRYLAQSDLAPSQVSEIRRIWALVRPASTAGYAGWLDLEDVVPLLRRLKDGEVKLSGLASSEELDAFRRAQTMLQAAITSHHGLCLVLSG